MTPLRQLHVVASSRGGGATHLLTLASGLAARGHEVAAALPADGGQVEAGDCAAAGVRAMALAARRSLPGRVRELASVIADFEPEIVHAHGSRAALWSRAALRLAARRRARLVFSVHGFAAPFYPAPRRVLQSAALRWIAGGAGSVIACCEAEREALLEARLMPPERVVAIPYGIDLAPLLELDADRRRGARAALGAEPDHWVVTMLCRIDRPRDFDSLLAAFASLCDERPEARLWIVGDGPQRPGLEAGIRDAGLQARVRLWGMRRDVAEFYAATDACVLTSWGWEGLPISVIEAQAAARPVIVTDAGGSREGIAPGETGLLVPRRDPAALGAALCRLAADPGLAQAMGARGRERARRRFAAATMVRCVEGLYATLA